MRYLLDYNAALAATTDSQYYGLLKALKNKADNINIFFSVVSFYELLNGIREEDFPDRINTAKRIFKVISGRNFLVEPPIHIIMTSSASSDYNSCQEYRLFKSAFEIFIGLKGYSDFKSRFSGNVEKEIEKRDSIVAGYVALSGLLRKLAKEARINDTLETLKNGFHPRNLQINNPVYLRQCCVHFKLDEREIFTDYDFIYSKYPSILYFAYAFWNYGHKLSFNNKIPKPSDYFDLELIPYLNLCDFLVTNDRKLAGLISNSGCDDIKDKVISIEDFFNSLAIDY